MRKIFTFLLALAASIGLSWAGELTVADGTKSNNCVPYDGYSGDYFQRVQIIYPQSELLEMAGKDITSLTFYVNSQASSALGVKVQIGLAEISDSDFSAGKDYKSATLTIVKAEDVWDLNAATVVVEFSKPFRYSGEGNILFDLQTVAKGGYGDASFYGVSLANYQSVYSYNESSIPATSSNRYKFIPKTTFTYEEPAPTTYTLQLVADPEKGSVAVTNLLGSDIIDNGNGNYTVPENAEVTILATPLEGYEFTGWKAGDISCDFLDCGTALNTLDNPMTIGIGRDVALMAEFAAVASQPQIGPKEVLDLGTTGCVGEHYQLTGGGTNIYRTVGGVDNKTITIESLHGEIIDNISLKLYYYNVWTGYSVAASSGDVSSWNYDAYEDLVITNINATSVTLSRVGSGQENGYVMFEKVTINNSDEPEPVDNSVKLYHNFYGDWMETEAFGIYDDYTSEYAKISMILEPGDYQFALNVGGKLRGDGTALSREKQACILAEGFTANLTLNVDVKGTYRFYWFYEENRFAMDVPNVCGMYWQDVTDDKFEVTLGKESEVTLPTVYTTNMGFASNIFRGVDQVRLVSTDETVATIEYTISMDGLGTITIHKAGECDIYAVHDITDYYCYDSVAFHLTVLPEPAGTVWTSLKVGDVIKVGDKIEVPAEGDGSWGINGNVLRNTWGPYTLIRADIYQASDFDDPEVTETEDGAFYVFKAENSDFYPLSNLGKGTGLVVTTTSDGLVVTAAENKEFTVAVHDKGDTPTAVENVQTNHVQATKFFRDGQLLIEKNGKIYNVQGVEVR